MTQIFEDEHLSPPRKIGCRVCMSTALLTSEIGERVEEGEKVSGRHGGTIFATYNCDAGHVTHAIFDPSDGSLRIYEPDDQLG